LDNVIVLNSRRDAPANLPGIEIVNARDYLTLQSHADRRRIRVFNLCRSYRYQSTGYYVSLLASARGHKPFPSVETIQDLKSAEIVRVLSDTLAEQIERSLASIRSDRFELSIYFGQNLAKRHERLARELFRLFAAPLLRARFERSIPQGPFQLVRVRPIAIDDVPTGHRAFLWKAARSFFRHPAPRRETTGATPYDIAILYDPDGDVEPPSDPRAIRRFARAAQALGMHPWVIGRDEYPRIAEFDALFIRETTNVNHHTYRFARRAAAEGLVVMDDPESIVRCTNKIFLAEVLRRHRVPTPETLVVGRDGIDRIASTLGFPCVLKQPDGAFSQGVSKARTPQELDEIAERLLAKSELIVAQSYMPTPFDWRVGVVDGTPLFVCRYFMASKHWQIIRNTRDGGMRSGRVECVSLEDAPHRVVRTAVRAARAIGNGLYGVDLKQVGRRVVVIEVNDNPSIEAGYEDAQAGEGLYRTIMEVFRRRIDARVRGGKP
jgi:glutathione synthase/RimK-type ligase-like ATP-grasp enzyme